jgi:hypothetical protein
VRLIGSPGQRNDIAFAHELIEGFAADVTIADKGYDADHLCDKIAESGGQPGTARSSVPMTPSSTRSEALERRREDDLGVGGAARGLIELGEGRGRISRLPNCDVHIAIRNDRLTSIRDVASDVSNAQIPLARRRLAERVTSTGPATEGVRQERSLLKVINPTTGPDTGRHSSPP